ncbi:MAG: hypothetical protein JWQ21_928 [Herminiimonas sp.]|jgi:hypothetical protein|nr:hypothetical protein [Herminiimonas sp.]
MTSPYCFFDHMLACALTGFITKQANSPLHASAASMPEALGEPS